MRNRRHRLSRRDACALLGALPWIASSAARAQQQLPVRATDLDHFGITVQDSLKTAEFFGRAFDPQLFAEMDSPTRLYVKLATAHMAIGNRPYWTRDPVELPILDHISARVEDYDQAALERALTDAGVVIGIRGFPLDPDGLFLQLGASPGGMSRTIIPAGRVTHEDAIVHIRGLDHLMVAVGDLARSERFYTLVFGPPAERTSNPDRIWYDVGTHTRLGLQAVAAGESPRFHHFALRAAGFDRRDATARLQRIGAVMMQSDEDGMLRFRDPNGLIVEIRSD